MRIGSLLCAAVLLAAAPARADSLLSADINAQGHVVKSQGAPTASGHSLRPADMPTVGLPCILVWTGTFGSLTRCATSSDIPGVLGTPNTLAWFNGSGGLASLALAPEFALAAGTLSLAAGGITTAKLAAGAVTYAKIQNETAGTMLGNPGASPAPPAEVSILPSLSLSLSGLGLANIPSGTPALGSIRFTASTPSTGPPAGFGDCRYDAVTMTWVCQSTFGIETHGVQTSNPGGNFVIGIGANGYVYRGGVNANQVAGLWPVAISGNGSDLNPASTPLDRLSQSGATTGQLATWNGSKWAPAAAPSTGADALGYYLVTRSTNAPVNAFNLGTLTTGLVWCSVTTGVCTPSTATSGQVVGAISWPTGVLKWTGAALAASVVQASGATTGGADLQGPGAYIAALTGGGTAAGPGSATLTLHLDAGATVLGLLPLGNQAAPTGTGLAGVTLGAWDGAATTVSTGLHRLTGALTADLSVGVSGGQSAIGGTATTDSLTIKATSASPAAGAKIYLQTPAGSDYFDVVTNTLTLGNGATPISLNKSAAQAISKSLGQLTIGTTDSNVVVLQTNGTPAISLDVAQGVTLPSLAGGGTQCVQISNAGKILAAGSACTTAASWPPIGQVVVSNGPGGPIGDSTFIFSTSTHLLTADHLTLPGSDSSGNAIVLSKAGNQYFDKQGTGEIWMGTHGAYSVGLYSNNANRLSFDSAGNLRLWTITTAGHLQTDALGNVSVDTATYQTTNSYPTGLLVGAGGALTSTAITSGQVVYGSGTSGQVATSTALTYSGAALGIGSSDGSHNALSLSQATWQNLNKSAGDLGVGTSTSNYIQLYTNGTYILDLSPTGQYHFYNTPEVTFSSGASPLVAVAPTMVEWNIAPPTVASAASLGPLHKFDAQTFTLTGTTRVTGSDLGLMDLVGPTITDASAEIVNVASTLHVKSAPTAAGSVTLNAAYALWVEAGLTRFDGPVQVAGIASALVKADASNTLAAAVAGTDYQAPIAFPASPQIAVGTGTGLTGSSTFTLTTGAVTIGSSDSLHNAISLNQAVFQNLNKSSGDLGVGTSTSHYVQVYTGGNYRLDVTPTGQFHVRAAPDITFTSNASATTVSAPTVVDWNVAPPTTASAAVLGPLHKVENQSLTLTGATRVTGNDLATMELDGMVITDAAAEIVNAASTLHIKSAPSAGGSVTLNAALALWVEAGTSRFDGSIQADTIATNSLVATDGVHALIAATSVTVAAALGFPASPDILVSGGPSLAPVGFSTFTLANGAVTIGSSDGGSNAIVLNQSAIQQINKTNGDFYVGVSTSNLFGIYTGSFTRLTVSPSGLFTFKNSPDLVLQAATNGLDIEFYKDTTPTKAVAIGNSVPSTTVTNDLYFSAYNGTSWSEMAHFANSGGNLILQHDIQVADLTANSLVATDGSKFLASPIIDAPLSYSGGHLSVALPTPAVQHFEWDQAWTCSCSLSASGGLYLFPSGSLGVTPSSTGAFAPVSGSIPATLNNWFGTSSYPLFHATRKAVTGGTFACSDWFSTLAGVGTDTTVFELYYTTAANGSGPVLLTSLSTHLATATLGTIGHTSFTASIPVDAYLILAIYRTDSSASRNVNALSFSCDVDLY